MCVIPRRPRDLVCGSAVQRWTFAFRSGSLVYSAGKIKGHKQEMVFNKDPFEIKKKKSDILIIHFILIKRR